MKLLLDTQLALWAITDNPKLTAAARAFIVDARNDIYVSIVSLWEIAIKRALGPKRRHAIDVDTRMAEARFRSSSYIILDIAPAHIHALDKLPAIHGDPFDRLLLAQAYETPLKFLTSDAVLPRYGDYVIGV